MKLAERSVRFTWPELVEYIGAAGWTIEDITDELDRQFLAELQTNPPPPAEYCRNTIVITKEEFNKLVEEGQELRRQFDKTTRGMRWN